MDDRSKKEIAVAIESTVRNIKRRYREIDVQVRASKIKFLAIDVKGLIRAECRKTKIPEKTIREIMRLGKNSTTIQVNEKEQD